MSKVLFVEPEKCTGCRSCELICSFIHAGEFNPLRSRISIIAFEKTGFSFPAVCQQCSVAACMEVCPVGAISVDDATGAKIVNHAVCLRCKMCTIACPFGATFYDADHDLIIKCDLCGGDPECVKQCPSGAISYREAKTANFNKRRATAEKFRDIMEEGR
ncbi:MAG TPA: 4Fe-4S dicluster domain-containing protein [Syntrophomonas sp.]|nr:4Fe-4S dicluster domain-containing protein [Syntrophomonas sp.]HPT68617.1 4Fe-4S dicluster domain-containing protein [Syntrophomonas sp.]